MFKTGNRCSHYHFSASKLLLSNYSGLSVSPKVRALTANPFSQPFWATTIYNAGLGPSPLRENALSTETLVEAFQYCRRRDIKQVASRIGERILEENGTTNAVQSFYRHLQWEKVRCSDINTEPVVYRMQLKPSIRKRVETHGVVMSTRGGGTPMEPYVFLPLGWSGLNSRIATNHDNQG